jgi:ACS family glucarate transporter-like MFS transporter
MSTPTGSTPSAYPDRPTRTRYWVIVFAVSLAIVQYIDRVAISQAMPAIAAEMKFDAAQQGMIFSAFTMAYALFEIPTGWLGDKLGAKKVLLRVVLWWSFFTAATGWMWNFTSMWVTRFLFGAGEAGCFPNLTKALGVWLPTSDRTRAQSIMWMGARWGGAIAPLLLAVLMTTVTWRTAFMLFALLGVAWAIAFAWWFRDNPKDHPKVNAAEYELLRENEKNISGHGNVPWRELVKRRSVWLLWAQYFCLSYGWYFYVTWLPTYLAETSSVNLLDNAIMRTIGDGFAGIAGLLGVSMDQALQIKLLNAARSGIPLFFGGIGALVGGIIASRLVARRVTVPVVRRALGVFGLTGAAALLMTSFYIKNPVLTILAMGLASFCNDLTMPGSWASCMDIGGKYAGTVSGSMNMMGNFGGMAGPIVTGFVLSTTNRDWQIVFAISSVIYFLGAICWLFIDPVTPLEKEETHA